MIFKMKPGTSPDDILMFSSDFKKALPDYVSSDVEIRLEDNTTLEKIDGILETVFDIVIVITMFLCFFSLSTSMTANLYE